MATRIIADDAGAVASIDEAVTELIDLGVLDGVAIFANWKGLKETVRWLDTGCDLGIHLNISTGRPVLQPAEIPTLVNQSSGLFLDPRDETSLSPQDKVSSYLSRLGERVNPEEVAAEFSTQYAVFESELGRPPSFVSVHHDLDIVTPIRTSADSLGPHRCRQSRIADGSLTAYEYRLHAQDTTTGAILNYFIDSLSASSALPDGNAVREVICHPARSTTGLEQLSIYCRQRVLEFSALKDRRVRRALGRET